LFKVHNIGLFKEETMGEIRMTGEIRTDYDCEAIGFPAERWGEAVFKIKDEEIVLEISVEEKVIVSIMVGEGAMWKGTLDGLKKLLKDQMTVR
jgi:hypothetical protein